MRAKLIWIKKAAQSSGELVETQHERRAQCKRFSYLKRKLFQKLSQTFSGTGSQASGASLPPNMLIFILKIYRTNMRSAAENKETACIAPSRIVVAK